MRFEPVGENEGGVPRTLDEAIHAAGHVPLPPYITGYEGDPEKYQTVYAMSEEHSAAAPTAGLHFTPELIQRIKDKGCGWATVELEVGIDTFSLVEEDDPSENVRHAERYPVPAEGVEGVHATNEAGPRLIAVGTTAVRSLERGWDAGAPASDPAVKSAGHRLIAVGTTAVRSLESAWDAVAPASEPAVTARGFEGRHDGADVRGEGDITVREDATTNLYLMPGSTFHVVDALITNFHVPRSTLMMLVSALATRDQIIDAYEEAVRRSSRTSMCRVPRS